ncbi:MAG TPA: hypothetical protein VGC14_07110 [Rhizobium sp.]
MLLDVAEPRIAVEVRLMMDSGAIESRFSAGLSTGGARHGLLPIHRRLCFVAQHFPRRVFCKPMFPAGNFAPFAREKSSFEWEFV